MIQEKIEKDKKESKKEKKEKKLIKKGEEINMVKNIVSLFLIGLFVISCDDNDSLVGPDYGTNTLELYSTVEQDKNGYYHYPYQGYNYGSIYYNTEPITLVGWDSPDEFCIQFFEELICEPVINYQTYSDENGEGQQNFYMNQNSIGDTLTLIGYLNSEVYDVIEVIIK